ncbi:MAG: polyribonucleotide nucleotidyltransferase [Candidatus Kapabacteria bacterium]|nr:polyribonucleotide nucleotidyltransferase [Candidatus Kapabacteria bacterium]
MSKVTVNTMLNEREFSLETGRFAKLADGAVMVRHGDTMVLVTVCANAEPKTDIDFLPMTIEYREKMSAAGKIPGGFFKREGKPSDKEILSARLIDRPIRPMFEKGWYNETQIVASVYSADSDIDPDVMGTTGASAALMLGGFPFEGPVSEVKIAKIADTYIVNPTYSQLAESELEITVAGTDDSLVMVEGVSKEISEDTFLEAIAFAHDQIRVLNQLQRDLVAQAGTKPKKEIKATEVDSELFAAISDACREPIKKQIRTTSTKEIRKEQFKEIRTATIEKINQQFAVREEFAGVNLESIVKKVVSSIEKEEMREMILQDGIRLDGRSTTQVRPITIETAVLPRPHGSALFTRGETQSLTTITLGTKTDEQMIDGLMPTFDRRFMLHYNFPPFSVGEAGRMTGTSRREVGHGNLAERALQYFIPDATEFPYTIRVLSDILESNGSSSMATVCAGSLAMMDAGVPIKKAVSGIAMGLIKEGDRVAILSDILGDEDHLGDMDFKVAGSKDGITACQMDMKIQGLSFETMKTALLQAKEGRMHILNEMNKALDTHRPELSPYAPSLTTIMIPVEYIGAVIGSGGENIRAMTKETNTEISIEDDGKVVIAAMSKESADEVVRRIKLITTPPTEGTIYLATVKEVREGLGAIVEFLPKTKGLLHLSQIQWEPYENVGDVLKVGEKVEVKLVEIQSDGKFRLSRKILFPKPEGYVEPERRPRPPQGDRNDRNDRNDRRPYDNRRGR